MLGMIKDSDFGSSIQEVDFKGLVNSFMMSVDKDIMWLPVVEQSSKMCYDQLAGSNEGWTCGGLLKNSFYFQICKGSSFFFLCTKFS